MARRLLALTGLAAASGIDLDWVEQFSAADKALNVAASENLTFTWTGTHDVALMADMAASAAASKE